MPTAEAQEIYEQASKLVRGDVSNKRSQRDGAAMLLIALERAGGPFPDADAELAFAYFNLYNNHESMKYADRALKLDPHQFTAQWVKTCWAFSTGAGKVTNQILKSEIGKLGVIFERHCRQDTCAGLFVDRSRLLMKLADLVMDDRSMSTPELYAAIANAPIDHLDYENDDQRVEVQKLRIIAQGRMRI